MQPEFRTIPTGAPGAAQDFALQQHKVLRNTYMLLALSLIPTVIGAAIGTNLDLSFMRTSPILSLVAILADILRLDLRDRTQQGERASAWCCCSASPCSLGLLLGPLLHRVLGFRNGTELVMMAAGGTAAVFFVMAGIASSTKRDFSGLGNFLTVGAVIIMLAVVANAFLASPMLYLVLVGAFVLFSSLMILWQVNTIVRGGETNYIIGDAQAVYLDLQPVLQPAATAGLGGGSD